MLSGVPRFLIPRYFVRIIRKITSTVFEDCILSSLPVSSRAAVVDSSDCLLSLLLLVSTQFYGINKDAPLIKSDIIAPYGVEENYEESLAAGIPHFVTGFMRSWGRDNAISVIGLLCTAGRFNESEKLLSAMAMTIKFGLIPNLLDSGVHPRYNARDATWWWIHAVISHCEMIEAKYGDDGYSLLRRRVPRLFALKSRETWTVAEAVQHVMEMAASGIHFREENSGPKLDTRMQSQGFDIDIGLKEDIGMTFGGNIFNCGTWMDKMGESKEAGNFSVPATPRDGSPVEIVALLYRAVVFCASNAFPYDGVRLADNRTYSYIEWAQRLEENFSKFFFIEERGYMRDVLFSSLDFTEEYLRPNQLVVLVVAPQLLRIDQAARALKCVETKLKGPLGIKTLAKSEPVYSSKYVMGETGKFETSMGFSYHNGPEWIWMYGYYVMALTKLFKLHSDDPKSEYAKIALSLFPELGRRSAMVLKIRSYLQCHEKAILSSHFFSLTELMNEGGVNCPFSSPAQAWSIGTILEAITMLYSL